MRPHWGRGGSSKKRTTRDVGAATQPSTTAPAARLATMKPPLKANVVVSDVVVQSAAVPSAPTIPSTAASRLNHLRCAPSCHSVRPMEMAAPTKRACARQSVP